MLVGRSRELGRIERFLGALRAGEGPLLSVCGPAGIGKTALVDAAAAMALRSGAGWTVLRTTGVETAAGLASGGLADLCDPVLGHLEQLPRRQAEALAGALAIGPAAAGDDLAVAVAVLALLRAEAAERPVLLVVDDAQWLDPATARCLDYVAHRLGGSRVGLLAAARDDDVPAWLAPFPTLAPLPLDEASARALLRTVSAGLRPAAVDAVLAVAGGNPLALHDLPLVLDDDEHVGLGDPMAPLELGPRLQAAFGRRIDRRSPEAREMILLAAAAGPAPVGVVLDAAAEQGLSRAALREAEDAGLLFIVEGRVEVAHPLVRSAAYHGATVNEQRDAHRALARVLDDEHRAWHLAAAAVGPDDEAARALDEAAGRARARHAYAAAASGWQRAAELSTAADDRVRRFLRAGEAALVGGSPEHALQRLDAAAAAGPDAVHAVYVQYVRGLAMLASPTTVKGAIAALASAAEATAPHVANLAAAMYADAAYAAIVTGAFVETLEHARRARALVQPDAGPDTWAPVLAMLAAGQVYQGASADARETFARLDETVSQLPADSLALRSVPIALQARIGLGDLGVVGERTDALSRSARDAGAYLQAALLGMNSADVAYRRGEWDRCEGEARELAEVCRGVGQRNGLYLALCVEARLHAARGAGHQARALVDEVLGVCEPGGADALVAYALGAQGLLELGTGAAADAVETFARLHDVVDPLGLAEPTILPWRADAVEALLMTGRIDEARAVARVLDEQAAVCRNPVGLALAARCRGLVAAEVERAEFEAALAHHDEVPMPFERARTLLAYGARLRRANQRTEARTMLHDARTIFEQLGARSWVERATTELRAAGGRVRRRDLDGPSALTEREALVARAVASGATNREIAAELFVSVKTVEFHLGKVFDKLGVRSRTQLAARLLADPPGGGQPGAAKPAG